MSTATDELLVLSAIGSDRPGIVKELANACVKNQCNIIDSRMTVLGGEFAVIMMVSGNNDHLTNLESALSTAAAHLHLNLTIKRTTPREKVAAIAYNVNVVALDNPGIVHEIAGFFSEQGINIDDLETGTYAAPHTGTQMFDLNMTVNIPQTIKISKLREEFLDFCDDLNLDAVIEPSRNN